VVVSIAEVAAGDAPAGRLAAGGLTAGEGVAALLEHAEATRSAADAVARSRHAIPRVAAKDRVIVFHLLDSWPLARP
jgi:hypothetical protein